MATIHIDSKLCKGCGICVEFCPMKVFRLKEDLSESGIHLAVAAEEEKCTVCRLCELYCPDFAVAVVERGKPSSRKG